MQRLNAYRLICYIVIGDSWSIPAREYIAMPSFLWFRREQPVYRNFRDISCRHWLWLSPQFLPRFDLFFRLLRFLTILLSLWRFRYRACCLRRNVRVYVKLDNLQLQIALVVYQKRKETKNRLDIHQNFEKNSLCPCEFDLSFGVELVWEK